MKQDEEKMSAWEEIVDDAVETHPHCREIVNAFRPVVLARKHLVGALAFQNPDLSKIDKTKFEQGIPCVRQVPCFLPDDPWEDVALSAISAIGEGFPALRKDLMKLDRGIRDRKVGFFEAYASFPDSIETAVSKWAAALEIDPPAVAFLLRTVTRVVLEGRAIDPTGILKEMDWSRGYCPVCGAYPTIAVIEEKITRRWLHCSQCGCEWLFSRVLCPYCDHEGQDGMDYYFVEDNPRETAFTCSRCKRYIVTLKQVGGLRDHDWDISAMSLAHLDVLMQGKGFAPMTPCEWNVF